MTEDTSSRETVERIDPAAQTTITLEQTVDVRDADEETTHIIRQLADCYEELFETVVDRNLDYGSSFLETGEATANRDGGPFEDAKRANLYGLFTRSGDKRNRFFKQVFANGIDASDEPVVETALDAANYWVLIAWTLRHYQGAQRDTLDVLDDYTEDPSTVPDGDDDSLPPHPPTDPNPFPHGGSDPLFRGDTTSTDGGDGR